MSNNKNVRIEDQMTQLREINADIGLLLITLKQQLDPIHTGNAELHQLWLETQWLHSNHRSNLLCLPRNWSLLIFRMARGDSALKKYPQILRTAQLLAQALLASIPAC